MDSSAHPHPPEGSNPSDPPPPVSLDPPQESGGADLSPSDVTVQRRGNARAAASDASTASLDQPPKDASSSEPAGHQSDDPAAAAEALAAAKTVIRKSSGSSAHASTGRSPAEIASVLLGHQLNHFILDALIGGGGMGAVFRAHDTRLERTVAIKVIPRVGEDPDLLRRFRNEAQSAAKLDHPNIARVYDVGRHEEWHYIVFEYIDGTNVRDLVNEGGVLEVDDAVYFTRQVAEALDHASQRGVVHRDIKPSNVLIRPDGQVKLVDMGLARSMQLEVSGDMTASGVTLGTFDYISPEQARDPRDADVRSDIYSLGCTLYFMLTGQPPYPGGTVLQKLLSHGNSPPPHPRDLRREVSDDLTAILHKTLAKRPSDRYRRPVDLIADLAELARRENLLRSQGLGAVTISNSTSWLTRLEKHLPWMVAAAVLLLSVAWLQVLSLAPAVDATLPQPTAQAAPPVLSSTVPAIEAASEAEASAPASDDQREADPKGDADDAATDLLNDATQPPPMSALPIPNELDPFDPDTLPKVTTTLAATRVRVGGNREVAPEEMRAKSLAEALQIAAQYDLREIEIAEPVLKTEPLVIRQSGLVIRGAEPGCRIEFENSPLLAMEDAVMVDVLSDRVEFENLQFEWSVPSNAVYGGALFAITENRGVKLRDCVLTVENASLRDPINAFFVRFPRQEGREDQENTASPARQGPPLVAIELQNVVVRGEMTMVRMDNAAQLQLRWENGLLALSQRMLETSGARSKPPAGRTQIKLLLRNITAALPAGLAMLNLGPSGEIPVVIHRESFNCAYTTGIGGNHLEINGVEDAQAGPWVLLEGHGNHYDSESGRSDRMVAINPGDDSSQLFRLDELAGNEPPAWMQEQAPQSVINWTRPTPPKKPAHEMLPADFLQDGTVLPGFDLERLPPILGPQDQPPESDPEI